MTGQDLPVGTCGTVPAMDVSTVHSMDQQFRYLIDSRGLSTTRTLVADVTVGVPGHATFRAAEQDWAFLPCSAPNTAQDVGRRAAHTPPPCPTPYLYPLPTTPPQGVVTTDCTGRWATTYTCSTGFRAQRKAQQPWDGDLVLVVSDMWTVD